MPRRTLLVLIALPACGRAPAPPTPGPGAAPPEPSPAATPAHEPAPPSASGPAPPARIGALSSRVLVRRGPRAASPEIGVLHVGAVVPLRSREAAGSEGCAGGWYPVEPEGYVCLDASTTLDVDDHPLLRAKRAHHGDFDSATPFRWSTSREGLLYRKLPTPEEQRRTEFELDRHLANVQQLRELREKGAQAHRVPRALRDVDVRAARADVPAFLASGQLSPWALVHEPHDTRPLARWIPPRSTIAWTDEFVAGGRTWVLTDELLVAPKDKLVPLEASTFAGVLIDGERVRLPIAFVRHEDKPRFRFVAKAADLTPVSFSAHADAVERPAPVTRAADLARSGFEDNAAVEEPNPDDPDPLAGFHEDRSPGEMVASGERWPRLAWVGLTGRFWKNRRERWIETTDGHWMRERDATLVEERPPRGLPLTDGEKWIDISIFKGTLVAYEGERAVFATLVSPGANGYKRQDGARARFTTPTGTFRIEWKHRSTTMTPDPERRGYSLAEVPYTQFFHMPFALHAAYWHDRFGEPKSGGCVNLSPRDARWLFEWTDPPLPETWHGVRSGDARGPGTWVRVR